MKVNLKQSMSGPGGTLDIGEHDFETAEAVRLIEAGIATPVVRADYETAAGLIGAERAVIEKTAVADALRAQATERRRVANEAVAAAAAAEDALKLAETEKAEAEALAAAKGEAPKQPDAVKASGKAK